VHMGSANRPVVHDGMVVGNLDIFEIGGAEASVFCELRAPHAASRRSYWAKPESDGFVVLHKEPWN